MRRIALEAGILILLAILIGIGSAGIRRPPVPLRLPDEFFVPESGARLLLLAQAVDLLEKGGTLFVDVRSGEAFVRGHIPGALSIPADRYSDLAASAADWLEGVPLLLYGAAGNVNDADTLAGLLMEYGYGPISIMVEGYEAWVGAGHDTGTGLEGVLDPDPWDDDDNLWNDEEDLWDEGGNPGDEGDDLPDYHRGSSPDHGEDASLTEDEEGSRCA